jgi:hypothetical protein
MTTQLNPVSAATNVEAIRNFWNALPDHAGFYTFFENPLSEVTQAERDFEQAKQAMADAKRRKKEAIKRLADRVESAAAREWSPEQIAQARIEGGSL